MCLCVYVKNLLVTNDNCRYFILTYKFFFFLLGFFGGNISDIAISGVKCTGNEGMLDLCLHDAVGEVFCPESGSEANIAGVTCVNSMCSCFPSVMCI